MKIISENLAKVEGRIKGVLKETRLTKNAKSPQIVAVSKRQPPERVDECLLAGHRVFGENQVLEALQRWESRKLLFSNIKLHLIGHLQTNKAKQAVQLFDVIEVVDRESLARTLQKEVEKSGRQIEFLVQVNTGEEKQKSGILPEQADAFVRFCLDECKLNVVGLMCIPPLNEEASIHFALLAEIAKRNGLEKLSMGMSGDYEAAVAFGATSVRIGSAIFGERLERKTQQNCD